MKAYVKPELFYERYELSQHIADCAWELQSASENTCIATGDPGKLPGLVLFNSGFDACKAEEGSYNEYCYQGGNAMINVFKS